jgi:SAM-dependent methyltransferase
MAEQDRRKWNEKYARDETLLRRETPARFVEAYWHFAGGGRAVDLACGGGRNALYLAKKGFAVDALDISEVAIGALKAKAVGLPVRARVVDLDGYEPPEGVYGLAVMANFLDRSLIARMADALKPGGLFIVETYMKHPDNEKAGNPDFLLDPGELRRLFDGRFQVIDYDEFWNEGERYAMRKQAIAARRRSDG